MASSFVVTGGGRGVGRAIVERLLGDADTVVVLERDPGAVAWLAAHPAGRRLVRVRLAGRRQEREVRLSVCGAPE